MAQYRSALPQLGGRLFLTDGGIETTLIFDEGLELPYFAAFDLLKQAAGTEALARYFRSYAEIAKRFDAGLILESATWRASADWGAKLGYSPAALADANRKSIHLLEEVRAEYQTDNAPVVISGCLGPRGDGYDPGHKMTEPNARAYHRQQIETFSETTADVITAITMTYVEEAVGIAQAAGDAGMPVVISFTVETDGTLPTGQTLKDAIEQVDAVTSSCPSYFMINCAHPTHFQHLATGDEPWLTRIHGLRANASRKSHAELDESSELDVGDRAELAAQYAQLKRGLLQLNVMGGCCGTDHRHVEAIARACSPLFRAAT